MEKPTLEEYVYSLNKKALELNLRNNSFVPPKGMVITARCDKGITRLGIATGLGGVIEHEPPPDLIFVCKTIRKTRDKSILEYITSVIFKL
jgi:hypothetical protein